MHSFQEHYEGQTGLTIGVKKQLFAKESAHQKIEILTSDAWGRVLIIDGMVMLSQKDEFVYHEMLSHVPLFTHPYPRRVCIIGGGDGGTAREVMRHPDVEKVDLVEIDATVIRACQQFLPAVGDWQNKKLTVHTTDGVAYLQQTDLRYDVLLIDGSDPVGPAQSLFESDFLDACTRCLRDDGVLAAQAESPWVRKYQPGIHTFFRLLNDRFSHAEMYLAAIPLYPAGLWSFALASKKNHPLDDEVLHRVEGGVKKMDHALKYYNGQIHRACFALPNFVREIMG